MPTALVVHSSRHGATAGIAERIGAVLRAKAIETTVASAREAPDPGGFDAYVVGSGVYIGKWEKDATSFVKQHQAILGSRPVWLFSSGPVGTERVDSKGNDLLADPQTVVELAPLVGARGTRVFFGAWDPKAPGASLGERLIVRMPAIRDLLPAGDFRDWPAIEAWAGEIAAELAGKKAATVLSA